MCREHPAWKQLISRALNEDERIALVTTVFLDDSQVEIVGHLSGDNAQSLVDTIDGASSHIVPCSKNKLIDFHPNLYISSIRCWIASRQRSAEGACTICTGFVATKPCFRDRWRFRFVMTRQGTRCTTVGQRTCGRVSILVRKLQPRS